MNKYRMEVIIETLQFYKSGIEDVADRERFDDAIKAVKENQAYHTIGTVEECSVAAERMKPKKAGKWKSGYTCCTNCKRGVVTEDRFCSYCGQAIDWGNKR